MRQIHVHTACCLACLNETMTRWEISGHTERMLKKITGSKKVRPRNVLHHIPSFLHSGRLPELRVQERHHTLISTAVQVPNFLCQPNEIPHDLCAHLQSFQCIESHLWPLHSDGLGLHYLPWNLQQDQAIQHQKGDQDRTS